MKNILSLFLVAVLLIGCTLPAFAAEVRQGSNTQRIEVEVFHELGTILDGDGASQDVDVEYDVSGGYIVTIPETIVLSKTGETTDTVTVSKLVIERTQVLSVTITSENYNEGWMLTGDGDSTIQYSIKSEGEEVANGGAVLTCPGGTASATNEINFSLVGSARYAGLHTDTLTFAVSIDSNEQN